MGQNARYIDAADVAKLIRAELKRWPDTRFSVRTDRYAGGSSIRVRWTDGPPRQLVEAAIGHFHGATFDGMTDSTRYHDSELNGERVHFGNSYLFCERELGRAAYARVLQDLAGEWELGVPPGLESKAELIAWASSTRVAGPGKPNEYLSTLVHRRIEEAGRAALEEHQAKMDRLLEAEIAAAYDEALAEHSARIEYEVRSGLPGPETDPLTRWVEL